MEDERISALERVVSRLTHELVELAREEVTSKGGRRRLSKQIDAFAGSTGE
jgi:hypothetical protein